MQQVLLFMAHNKQLGMAEVCEFIRPFLNYSILRVPFSDTSSLFARHLISSMASVCCSIPLEAMPVLKMLTDCLPFVPHKNSQVSILTTHRFGFFCFYCIVVGGNDLNSVGEMGCDNCFDLA